MPVPGACDSIKRLHPSCITVGRMGDFHQYPSVYPQQQDQDSSHPSRPRPPPSNSSSTTAMTPPAHHYHQGPPSPYANATFSSRQHDSNSSTPSFYNSMAFNPSNSTYPRSSSDQNSLYSSISSITRNSVLSVTPNVADPVPSPMSFQSTEGFTLEQPRDDRVIEAMFHELMEKRGFMNLPEQAKRQMMAYAPSKKWDMVHQDKLADFQVEQKRRVAAQAQGRDLL